MVYKQVRYGKKGIFWWEGAERDRGRHSKNDITDEKSYGQKGRQADKTINGTGRGTDTGCLFNHVKGRV